MTFQLGQTNKQTICEEKNRPYNISKVSKYSERNTSKKQATTTKKKMSWKLKHYGFLVDHLFSFTIKDPPG